MLEARIESAPFNARIELPDLGQSRISYQRFDVPTRLSMSRTPYYQVLIPLEGSAVVHLPTDTVMRADSASGVAVTTDTDLDLVCAAGYAQVVVCIPPDLVHRELERLTGCSVDGPVELMPFIALDRPPTQLWRQVLAAIDTGSTHSCEMRPSGLASRRLERRLLRLLVTQQPHPLTGMVSTRPHSTVQRAIDLIEHQPERRWSGGELATAVGCGVRSLQVRFQQTVGATPMEYVRWVRLLRVHDELEGATAGQVTVTDVAVNWGFSHLGRFSAAYYQEFQEYPRETLQRDRQPA
jgi:AraC-like DNA-binding protein